MGKALSALFGRLRPGGDDPPHPTHLPSATDLSSTMGQTANGASKGAARLPDKAAIKGAKVALKGLPKKLPELPVPPPSSPRGWYSGVCVSVECVFVLCDVSVV